MSGSASQLRQPCAYFNGYHVLECEVHLTRLQSSSSFEVTVALDAEDSPGASYWANLSGQAVITATNGAQGNMGPAVLFTGIVDQVHVRWAARTARITGRDLTGKLLDTRSDQKWTQQSIDQVVQNVAQEAGLQVNTGSGANDVQAGRTYDATVAKPEYDFNSDAENCWDVVQACAQQVGNVAFVAGSNTLYFVDPTDTSIRGTTLQVQYQAPTQQQGASANFMELDCVHDVQLAGAQVLATTWNTYDKEAYPKGSSGSGSKSGSGATFYVLHPRPHLNSTGKCPRSTTDTSFRKGTAHGGANARRRVGDHPRRNPDFWDRQHF
jgi:hypothetical protein